MTDNEILAQALISGFMMHSGYGQSANKQMPVSDSATLIAFARAILSEKEKLAHPLQGGDFTTGEREG